MHGHGQIHALQSTRTLTELNVLLNHNDSLTHSRTLAQARAHSLTHSPTHPLTYSHVAAGSHGHGRSGTTGWSFRASAGPGVTNCTTPLPATVQLHVSVSKSHRSCNRSHAHSARSLGPRSHRSLARTHRRDALSAVPLRVHLFSTLAQCVRLCVYSALPSHAHDSI